jgi:hypothetical protein
MNESAYPSNKEDEANRELIEQQASFNVEGASIDPREEMLRNAARFTISAEHLEELHKADDERSTGKCGSQEVTPLVGTTSGQKEDRCAKRRERDQPNQERTSTTRKCMCSFHDIPPS